MSKSHVSMEHHLCVVCGKEYPTDAILMDTRFVSDGRGGKKLRESLERATITGWGMCPEHKKLRKDGYVALVAADEAASTKTAEGNIDPAGACRLGDVVHVRSRVWEHLFNVPVPPKGLAFCPQEVIDYLKKKMPPPEEEKRE